VPSIYRDLISNVALLLALSTLFNYLTRRWKNAEWPGQVLGGLAFGSTAIAGMVTSFRFAEGIIYDGRSIVLGLAGYFGGWIVGSLAAALAGAYRLWLGGGGTLAGVGTILTSAALGIAYRAFCSRRGECDRPISLYLFGLLVHLAVLLWQYFGLPGSAAPQALRTVGLPMMIIFPAATLLTGLLLADQERHILAAKALEENESRLQSSLRLSEALNRLALALGEARDLGAIFSIAYDHVAQAMDTASFIVSMFDREEELIHAAYVVVQGEIQDASRLPPIPLEPEGQGTQSRVIRSGEPLYISDARPALLEGTRTVYSIGDDGEILEGPPPEEEREEWTRSMLLVPMKAKGETLGVMQVQSWKVDAYSQEDADLLRGMANLVAGAVQNARLYEKLQEEIARLDEAHKALESYSERLEEMVDERTRALREAQEELLRKERLSTMGQLASSVAHEVRNPLGVITNAVYFLKSVREDAPVQEREYLDLIEKQVASAMRIVNDLLEFTRPREPQREQLTIGSILQRTLDGFFLPEGISLDLNAPENGPTVVVDPFQIQQVIANLLSNAVQAMPEGGQLEISVSQAEGEVCLSVRDTGVGILPEHAERIFEPLFSTKARGFGLGLSISKNLIEANEGRIWFEPAEGGGTVFHIALPVEAGEERGAGLNNAEEKGISS